MTLAELRTYVRNHTLGTQGIVLLSDAQVDIFIGTALDLMLNDHDWQFQQTTVTFDYGVAGDGVELPIDYIQDIGLYLVDTTQEPAKQRTRIGKYDAGRTDWVATVNAQGTPTFPAPDIARAGYYIFNSRIYVVPQPTTPAQLSLDYVADITILRDENPFIMKFPRTVLLGAIAEAYSYLHEDERAALATQNFGRLVTAAKKRDVGQRMSGPPKRRG